MKEELNEIVSGLHFLVPELLLFGGFIILILGGFFFNRKKHILPVLAALILGFDLLMVFLVTPAFQNQEIYGGMLHVSSIGQYIKVLILSGGIITVFASERYFEDFNRKGEFYALIISLILAGNILIMSGNLLIVFIALEMIALCSYIMVAIVEDPPHIESSMKYIYYGLFSAALTLFGFTFLYGFSGSISFLSSGFAGLWYTSISLLMESLQPSLLLTTSFTL